MMRWDTPGSDTIISVYHNSWEDGGGTWFGHEYPDILAQRYPGRVFDRCYEWCSGPGFIGFSIMSRGLCSSLCLSDLYAPVADSISATVEHNRLQGLVNFYAGDSLDCLPAAEMFDLVVSNPPHFLESPGDDNTQRIKVDRDWAAHRDFYSHISKHLRDDGIILIQENMAGSDIKDFQDMIHNNGLTLKDWFLSPNYHEGPQSHLQIYYLEIVKNDTK